MAFNVLLVNSYGYLGGDVEMYLLGLPHLKTEHFHFHIATLPRGAVYDKLKTMAHLTLYPMEMGGKELALNHRLGKLYHTKDIVAALYRLTRIVRKENIALIYSLDRGIAMPLAYLASKLSAVPLALNAQITHYLDYSAWHHRVIQHAGKISVSSQDMHAKFLPYLSSSAKMSVIPNAIRANEYNPNLDGSSIRQQYAIPFNAPIIVLAGRLSPFKGPDDLIRAAKIIIADFPDCYFLLAGREDLSTVGYKAKLEEMIQALGLTDRVKLIGYRQDLDVVFASANVVVMPSHEEAFGLVALEGLAMGKPVVATRAGGVPEFMIDGEIGYLIEPKDYKALADRILRLLRQPEKAKRMGEKGRKRVVSLFNDELYAKRIGAFLAEAIEKKPSPRSMPAFTIDN